MPVEFIYGEDRLTAVLKGDIDHHSAAEMRIMIDGELERSMPKVLLLDFSGVGFMDSSGVGLILGRMRKISAWGGKAGIVNPTAPVKKILKLSGLESFVSGGERSGC
ncbi:MAG: anti-sigma factor antagonist [Ruminiclostridium sp.]